MRTIKDFMQDTNAMIIEWLVGLFGLLLLIFAYVLFMPLNNTLILIMVENGAPLAQELWIRTMFKWAFLIFGILCIAYPFVSTYRKTYDQGIQRGGWQ